MTRRVSARWLVPLVAATVLAGTGAVVSALANAANADLAPRSASQLLVDVQRAHLRGLSGTIEENADLGLPALPGLSGGPAGSTNLSTLVSGHHTLRLWYAGPARSRLAVLSDQGESDLVRNGRSVWSWSSPDKTATHWTLPTAPDGPFGDHRMPGDGMPGHGMPGHMWSGHPMRGTTPQDAADAALAALSPTTRVTANGTTVVAGRSAYVLSLTPRSADTLVQSVQIAIDGATHVPTRVQVFAKGHTDPVFQVGFTSFDPTVPPASRFEFVPPPGAKVTQKTPSWMSPHGATGDHTLGQGGARPRVVGSGWSSVVVAPLPDATGTQTPGASENPMSALTAKLPRVSGSWGSGRLLSGTLFSVVLTDDGRVAAGAVPPRMLYAALAKQ